MTNGSDRAPSAPAARPGARLLAAALVVVAFVLVVVIVIARLPGPPVPVKHAVTTTSSVATGRAAVAVLIELPATPTTTTVHGATTTTSSSTTTTVARATTTTAAGKGQPTSATIDQALRAAGFDVVGEVVELSPPAATSVQFTTGHEADADEVAELLGLSSAAVVAYTGAVTGLPVGTDVVVVIGKAA